MSQADETSRNLKKYLSREHPAVEAKSIPNPVAGEAIKLNGGKPIKKETPKSDAFNDYDYSDDTNLDDKEW